jgi:tetratricopeptide (TPR) repeat protein
LALLHLFQGFVDVNALRVMGSAETEWCLAAVHGLTRERGIALLDRGAEIGLLHERGDGYYDIHPALPWYFRALFAQYFPEGSVDANGARRAFVEAMGELGNLYHYRYNEGRREVLSVVMAEEDNLLVAWRLARAHGWWKAVAGAMQGLDTLYEGTGRRPAWRRLVDDVVPDFVDPASDGPLAGREDYWGLVTGYRVGLCKEERNWAQAERLQRGRADWVRQRAQPALATPPDQRNEKQRNAIRTLVVSLNDLASIQREQGSPACVATNREALDLATVIGDTAASAACAFSLGDAYKDITDLRNLDEAERWYRKSFDLQVPNDGLGRGRCLGQLGLVAYQRFWDALSAKRPGEELARYLTEAARLYQQALDMMPATAITERGIMHNQLGNVYVAAGDIDRSLHHYQEDIRYCEQAGDIFGAGQTRLNVAASLKTAGRLSDARAYAEAALADFRTFGDRAADQIQIAERQIAALDQAIAKIAGGA